MEENADLKKELVNFRNITLEIIVCLEKDDLDSLDGMFSQRQKTIERINLIKYNKEDFKSICNEVDIITPDKRLYILLNDKRLSAKKDIYKLSVNKNANLIYKSSFGTRPLYYNKKI